MEWYLPVIWATLIGTAVALYVILDGFDLGTGIPFAHTERERDQSRRFGTATKPGSFWAAAGCGSPSRQPMR